MSLPTTGPISFNAIKLEFGDIVPVSLNEFYAGGGKVPVGTQGPNGYVPTAGMISMNQLHGISGSLLTGARWRKVSSTITPVPWMASSGSLMVASGSSLAQVSTDNGFTWTQQVKNLPTGGADNTPLSYTNGRISYAGGRFYDVGVEVVNSYPNGYTQPPVVVYYGELITSTDGYNFTALASVLCSANPATTARMCLGSLYGTPLYLFKQLDLSNPSYIYAITMTSTDGLTWNTSSHTPGGATIFQEILYFSRGPPLEPLLVLMVYSSLLEILHRV